MSHRCFTNDDYVARTIATESGKHQITTIGKRLPPAHRTGALERGSDNVNTADAVKTSNVNAFNPFAEWGHKFPLPATPGKGNLFTAISTSPQQARDESWGSLPTGRSSAFHSSRPTPTVPWRAHPDLKPYSGPRGTYEWGFTIIDTNRQREGMASASRGFVFHAWKPVDGRQ